MRRPVMFITAVCLIFLVKLKWPKNKSVYDLENKYHESLQAHLESERRYL